MILTFDSVDKILRYDHSNESSLPVFTHGAICFSNEMWEFGRNLLSAKFGSERVRYRTLPTGVLSVHANRPRGPDFSGVKFAFARFLFNICNLQVKETTKFAFSIDCKTVSFFFPSRVSMTQRTGTRFSHEPCDSHPGFTSLSRRRHCLRPFV